VDATAAAISDPVRREILVLLRGGPVNAGQIASHFPISRPAISRHLRVLRESGLVHDELFGRSRLYRLDTGPLAPIQEWLSQFQPAGDAPWERRLDALATEVHRTRRERAHPASRPTQQQEDTA